MSDISDLFVLPPTINPADYMSVAEARKLADVRLQSSPGAWSDEVTQALCQEHPYIPIEKVVVNFKRKDDAAGSAFGYVGVVGAPRVSIPVIIHNRMLKPLDVMIVRADTKDAEQDGTAGGVGDMKDDRVMPLNQETFSTTMDAGEPGRVVLPNEAQSTGHTEDGSSLRLPFRGRTVVASVVGVPAAKQAALQEALKDRATLAGFAHNRNEAVIESWLNAKVATDTVSTKLAALAGAGPKALAVVPDPSQLPGVHDGDDFLGHVLCSDDRMKCAAALEVFDLCDPDKAMARMLVFEDGTYCAAPTKVAGTRDEVAAETVGSKLLTSAMTRTATVMLETEFGYTAPLKIASIFVEEASSSITATLTDGLRKVPVVFTKGVKVASFDDESKSWTFPLATRLMAVNPDEPAAPMSPQKAASVIASLVPCSVVVTDGSYALRTGLEALDGTHMTRAKIATVLSTWYVNGADLLDQTDELAAQNAGKATLRFAGDVPAVMAHKTAGSALQNTYGAIAKETVAKLASRNPLVGNVALAAKLAAAIGDPAGADAVLGTGFLNEDNLAEFTGLAPAFEDTCEKLARLLLAVRMGFPGDESATAVAMKSLHRVSDDLRGVVGDGLA